MIHDPKAGFNDGRSSGDMMIHDPKTGFNGER
jgi:hypothetical protein